MPEYRVIWEIDITADSPREAAEEAQAIQLRPGSATVFTVIGEGFDRLDGESINLDDPKVL